MKKKKNFPKIKKNIKNFLLSEEGKISKQSVMKAGLVLGALGLFIDPVVTNAQHASHGSHGSHASHGSHTNYIHNSSASGTMQGSHFSG